MENLIGGSYTLAPRPHTRGIPETFFCRILVFMWSLGSPYMGTRTLTPGFVRLVLEDFSGVATD